MNWFKKHLNWTFVLATVVAYIIALILSVTVLLTGSSVTDVTLDIMVTVIIAGLILPVGGWYLKQKGRKLWWLLILFVPFYFGFVYILTLDNLGYLTKEDSEIRKRCLEYFEQELQIKHWLL